MKKLRLSFLFSLCLQFLIFSKALGAPQFNRNQVGDIALVIASAKGFGASLFGHSFLRIQSKAGIWTMYDYVIEIAAFNEGNDYNNFRGLGLIAPYPAKLSVQPYSVMLDLKTKQEYRDLDNYVLNISVAQRNKILDIIEELLKKQNAGDYLFLTQNCASYVSEILRKSGMTYLTGLWANIPSELPGKLYELGRIRSHFQDRSANSIRESMLKKFQNIDSENTNIKLIWPALKEQLGSTDLEQRLLAYIKLYYISTNDANASVKNHAEELLRQQINLESYTLALDLKRYFFPSGKSSKLEIYPLFEQTISYHEINSVKKLRLVGDEQGASILAESKTVDRADNPSPSSKIKIPYIQFNLAEGLFFYADSPIGIRLSGEIAPEKFFAPSVSLFHEVVFTAKGDKRILLYLVIDKSQKLFKTKFNPEDLISISNIELAFKFKNAGACYGVAFIQQAFYLRSLFRPELPKLADINAYYFLIEKLLAGQYVIFPGYKDVKELTESLDQTRLMSYAIPINDKINAGASVITNYLNSRALNIPVLRDIKRLSALGIPSLISLQKKGTPIGHVLLIQDVIEQEKEFELLAYDANTKMVNKFSVDKKNFDFHSPLYKDFTSPRLLSMDIRAMSHDLFRKQKIANEEFIRAATLSGKYYFSAEDVGFL